MIILLAVAAVSLFLGILLLVNLKFLEKLSDILNTVIIDNKKISGKHSKALGIFLIVFSAILFSLALKYRAYCFLHK